MQTKAQQAELARRCPTRTLAPGQLVYHSVHGPIAVVRQFPIQPDGTDTDGTQQETGEVIYFYSRDVLREVDERRWIDDSNRFVAYRTVFHGGGFAWGTIDVETKSYAIEHESDSEPLWTCEAWHKACQTALKWRREAFGDDS